MFIDSNRLIRLSTGGCVAINSDINSRGRPGYAIQIAAIDFALSIDSILESVLILRSALANAFGLRVINAPVESAAYSRFLDIAMRNNGVIIVLNTAKANHTIINIAVLLPRLSLSDVL